MVRETGLSKPTLSAALTGSFFAYALGELVSGVIGDKMQPKKLVFTGLSVSVLMNTLIPVCNNAVFMTVIWCINGFFQAMIYPPLTRLMVVSFNESDYLKASLSVGRGGSYGTMVVYLVAPLMITLSGWRAMFVFSAVCGIIMLFLWEKFAFEIEQNDGAISGKALTGKISKREILSPFVIVMMIAIIIEGALRESVNAWMPSYISETYNLSSAAAILTGFIRPLFSIFCFQTAFYIRKKSTNNPVFNAGIVYALGGVGAIFIKLLSGNGAAYPVIFSTLVYGCMCTVGLMFSWTIVPAFEKSGKVSTVTGILDACTYMGSAVATYGIAVISEYFGWQITALIWIFLGISGTIITFSSIGLWKRFIKK